MQAYGQAVRMHEVQHAPLPVVLIFIPVLDLLQDLPLQLLRGCPVPGVHGLTQRDQGAHQSHRAMHR